MTTDHIFFGQQEFPYAVVKIFGGTKEEEYINVSTIQLEHLLLDPETYVPTSPEAELLDSKIDFYLETEELTMLPESDIVHLIESSW